MIPYCSHLQSIFQLINDPFSYYYLFNLSTLKFVSLTVSIVPRADAGVAQFVPS